MKHWILLCAFLATSAFAQIAEWEQQMIDANINTDAGPNYIASVFYGRLPEGSKCSLYVTKMSYEKGYYLSLNDERSDGETVPSDHIGFHIGENSDLLTEEIYDTGLHLVSNPNGEGGRKELGIEFGKNRMPVHAVGSSPKYSLLDCVLDPIN